MRPTPLNLPEVDAWDDTNFIYDPDDPGRGGNAHSDANVGYRSINSTRRSQGCPAACIPGA